MEKRVGLIHFLVAYLVIRELEFDIYKCER